MIMNTKWVRCYQIFLGHCRLAAVTVVPCYVVVSAPHLKIKHHGPLTRFMKLRVVHAPGMMPGTFSPPLTAKETAS